MTKTADDHLYVRDAGCGYAVALDYSAPAFPGDPSTAHIVVLASGGKVVLDSFDVPKEKALDALHHTSLYSTAYADALR